MALSARYDTQLALLLLDLDRFKPVNHNYGYLVGDLVLLASKRVMVHTIRKISLTVSIGVVSSREPNQPFDSLVQFVDKALCQG